MTKAKTEIVSPGIDQIPFEGMEALGEIFHEGQKKYGLDNWKNGVGDEEYQAERVRHAIRHLMLYANGDRSEDHVAKVGWWAITTLWAVKNHKGTCHPVDKPTEISKCRRCLATYELSLGGFCVNCSNSVPEFM